MLSRFRRKLKTAVWIIAVLQIIFMTACEKRVNDRQDNITRTEQQKQDKLSNEKSDDRLTIGATLASEDSTYIVNLVTYMKEAAETLDADLIIDYADWDAEIQEQQIDKFISQKVDAIILCPINSKSMLTPLKKVKEAKIPVINLNMKVDSISTEYIDTYVGASMSEEGTLAAEVILDVLGEQGGKVAIIEGSPGSDAQIYRTQAFMKKISTRPEIEVAALGNGDWDRNKAYMVTKDILDKNKEIKAIFSQDNNMAMGAIKALEEMEKQESVIVVGIGEDNEEYLQAIKDGKLYGTITQPPSFEGRYSIYTAVMAAKGNKLRPWYKDPIEIITRDDLQ